MTRYEFIVESEDIDKVRENNHIKYISGDRDFETFMKVMQSTKAREEALLSNINELVY